ncbi:hypothetical protein [Marinovum sp.]|uniref:hypothetical protein n=1 Tax=Marinovum sp. TaxID=2024839 RepID=UPI002B274C3E|nr:hypothetical protein [Marinovum sp.]
MHRTITPLILAAALGFPAQGSAAPVHMTLATPEAQAPAEGLLVEVKSDKKTKPKKAKKAAKKKAKAAKKASKAEGHGKAKVKAKVKTGKGKAEEKIDTTVKDIADTLKADIQEGRITLGNGGTLAALAAPLAALGTAGLAEVLINCPPGLAKKAVPCVPPGQVDRQATAQEWTSRDEAELRAALTESQRRLDSAYEAQEVELISLEELDAIEYDDAAQSETVTGRDTATDPAEPDAEETREINERILRLTQEEIVRLFDLDPAPAGSKYVVIDGRPVLLDEENYVRIRSLRHLEEVDIFEVEVADLTEVMGHTELVETYDLPEPGADRFYALLDGELLLMPVEGYELLQLLRVVALAPSLTVAQAE